MALQPRNRTMEMTKLLVPALKKRGYRFVPLDAVPQVQAEIRRSWSLKGAGLRKA